MRVWRFKTQGISLKSNTQFAVIVCPSITSLMMSLYMSKYLGGTKCQIIIIISQSIMQIVANQSINTTCQSIIYLQTYSMVQSPSWAANWFAASQ